MSRISGEWDSHQAVEWAKDYFPKVDHPDYVLLEIKHSGYGFREPGTTEIVRIKALKGNRHPTDPI
jgi:hypothetical protein